MESTPESTRLATRLGATLLVMLIAGMTLMFMLSSRQWRAVRPWTVVGDFESGVSGLRVGSPVRVGGVELGHVTEIEVDPGPGPRLNDDPADGPSLSSGTLLVEFMLPAEIELRTDARIVHDVNPFSGIGELDVLNVGTYRSPALPGRTGRGATLAPLQPQGRPFALATRPGGLRTLLGRIGAEDWTAISEQTERFRTEAFATEAPIDPWSGEPWGPNREGDLGAFTRDARALGAAIVKDFEPWRSQVNRIRDHISQIQSRFDATETTPSSLVHRIEQLQAAFGVESGFRGLARELGPLFDALTDGADPVRSCLGPALDQGRLIAWIMERLWPEIRDDLLITKTGFAITGNELWLARGPEAMTTLIRAFQRPSARTSADLELIFAANAVALSAADLRQAVSAAETSLFEARGEMTPFVRRRLEGRVLPALEQYRHDLAVLLAALDRAALRR